MKRPNRNATPGGTITRTVFDSRGRAVQTFVGTNDAGATDADPTGGGAPGNNMVLVTQTAVRRRPGRRRRQPHPADAVRRCIDHPRHHLPVRLARPADGHRRRGRFYAKVYYDNLDRVTRTERYDTTLSGNLVARNDTLYDDRNRVYQSIRYGVDPTTGLVGNALTDNTWYDAAGNVLK